MPLGKKLTLGCVFALSLNGALAQNLSNIASTPPMGWNSWNHFGAAVTENDVRAAADALVANGMRDVGYRYVILDDGWQGSRDQSGEMQPNKRFPDIKALVDYVHSKGLLFGLYSSPGPKTCAGFEGSFGYEEQDARTYAGWGVDYLKYDLCGFRQFMREPSGEERATAPELMEQAYIKMHKALLKTGRPIVYSLCQYGWNRVWQWGAGVGGNLWRTTEDISDTYDRMSLIGFQQAGLAHFAGKGHWNDPDMLEIGNGGMNGDESRVEMSLWALLAAPLLAGNDLSHMSAETFSILSNREVVAVDQDPLGIQGDRVTAEGPLEIWAKPLEHGAKAVGLFNRGESPMVIRLELKAVGFHGPVKMRDLWGGRDSEERTGFYAATVPRHGVVMLKIEKQ